MIALPISDTAFSIYLLSTFLKSFFTPFAKSSTKAGLFLKSITTRIKTEKLPNNSHKQFYGTKKLVKLKFTASANLLKDNDFNLKLFLSLAYEIL